MAKDSVKKVSNKKVEKDTKEVKEVKEPKEFEVIQSKFIDRLLNAFSIHVQDENYQKPIPSLKQLPQTFAILYMLRNATTTVDDKEKALKPTEKFNQIISSVKNMKTCNNIKEFKLKNIQNSKLISQLISKEFEEEFQDYITTCTIQEDEPEKGTRRTVQTLAQYTNQESEEIQEQMRLNIIHKQMMSLYNIFVAACVVPEEPKKKSKKSKKESEEKPKEQPNELDDYTSEKELTKFIESKIKQLLKEEIAKENKKGETIIVKSSFQKNYEKYAELLDKPLEEVQTFTLKQPFLKLYSQNKKEWNLDMKSYEVCIASTQLLNKILKQWQDKISLISQTKRFDIEQKVRQSQKSNDIKEADEKEKQKLNKQFSEQKQQAIISAIADLFGDSENPLEIIYKIEDKEVKQKETSAEESSDNKKQKKTQKSKTSRNLEKKSKEESSEEPEQESVNVDDVIDDIVDEEQSEKSDKSEKPKEKKRRHHSRK